MKRFLMLLFLLITLNAVAQHRIMGKVLDKKNEGAIEAATVRLLNFKDSTLIQGCLTDEKGAFALAKELPGRYVLEVRFLGYNKYRRDVILADKPLILKNIYLEENEQKLQQVEVKGMTAQMAVKGDTIEYNTAAFKTAENAVVEDLLKKLPGVTVNTEGKITVNGEEIKKVRVDGKKFFGDDVQMATKNIPVDMVEKVQVLDQKSDMAQLTGFEDENTERILNLTIKENRKKGTFGNISAGGGADINGKAQYDANAFLNLLDENTQTAFVGGANNTNNIRSGRGRGGMSGGDGVTETQNLGINTNSEFTPKLKMGGDGSYNQSDNCSETSSNRQSWLSGATYENQNTGVSTRENRQANIRLELEWNIDTLTTLVLQPTFNYTKSYSTLENCYEFFLDEERIAWGESNRNNESYTTDAGMNFILSRKSNTKKGRVLTINTGLSLNNSNSDGYSLSEKNTNSDEPFSSQPRKNTTDDDQTLIDQRSIQSSDSYTLNTRISYVEPFLNQKNFIETVLSTRCNKRNAEKMQYNPGITQSYDVLDSTYSNTFGNRFCNETLELNFRHQDKKYRYMFGMKAEPSQTNSTTYYKNGEKTKVENRVFNYAPSAQLKYTFGKKKFARLEYRGRTGQPSIEQMQPVKDNSNPMNEIIGNASLNPSFEHSLRLMYSNFNAEMFSSLHVGLNASYTRDALVTNSVYDATGKQWSQMVNSEKAPFSINANIMFNTPVVKNRLQFNTRSEIGYQELFGYSDKSGIETPYDEISNKLLLGKLSQTDKVKANQSLSLTFTTDIVEIGIRGLINFCNTQNNLNENRDQQTTDWTGSGNINVHLPYNFNASNELSYTKREGYARFNRNEWIWNASIDKTVLNKKGTLSLKFYDILQQKQNIRESIGDNYRELIRSNVLTSYFMLSFTYKIARFGGGAAKTDMFRESRGGFDGGPGMEGFGGPRF